MSLPCPQKWAPRQVSHLGVCPGGELGRTGSVPKDKDPLSHRSRAGLGPVHLVVTPVLCSQLLPPGITWRGTVSVSAWPVWSC